MKANVYLAWMFSLCVCVFVCMRVCVCMCVCLSVYVSVCACVVLVYKGNTMLITYCMVSRMNFHL